MNCLDSRSSSRSRLSGVFRTDEGDPHHVGGAGCSERDARHDDDPLADLGESFANGELAGAERHVVHVARILGADRMHAPHQRQAPRRVVLGVSATTVELGRSRAMRNAVEPEDVHAAIVLRLERIGDLVGARGDRVRARSLPAASPGCA